MEKPLLIVVTALLAGIACHAETAFSLEEPVCRWTGIVGNLKEAGAIRSRFEEVRSNPFHRVPKRFSGTIRWRSDLGLSLAYSEPSKVVIRIAEDQLLIERDDHIRRIGAAEDQAAILSLVSRLFSWDTAWIEESFESSGTIEADDSWSLILKPREKIEAAGFTRLVLEGGPETLDRIFLDLRGGRAVEINLSDQIRRAEFSQQELETAFPGIDD